MITLAAASCLALNVYFEARDQDTDGQRLVAQRFVVANERLPPLHWVFRLRLVSRLLLFLSFPFITYPLFHWAVSIRLSSLRGTVCLA